MNATSNHCRPAHTLLVLLLFLAGCSSTETPDAQDRSTKPSIVSLAPSITEMIYAIGAGDQLVGRTSACDYPEEARQVQVTGTFGRPSLEVLASLNPDLVLDLDLADEQAGQKIRELGIRRTSLKIDSPDDIPHALRAIGRATGNDARADSLASVIEEGLAAFRDSAPVERDRPDVYLEIWNDPLWTGGSTSYTSALIRYAGGRNIGDDVSKEYFEISPEWVITRNPDIIACMYMSRTTPAAERIRARDGWKHIDAVRNDRIYDRFDNSLFLRPGPRVLAGIEQLRTIILEP
ncbi:cobalamin-binding protein [Prosthecochloris sp. N3]|uniref:Cobalamin-binding protein n=1 Tax=Prosthecochloris ethylica TaxID=2743976 RepID=A0ABR9XS72_9CHLB|nr:cobalamin-binding protein [Prosthecochloris ethylica]MBF0585350.1 cobalamin-binding protein [Prosthecochloris ethylica]MBF0636886.1 cobalamin-binding protein [Prosthecochloris ethylica]NUK46579.1 cobalamin-binding protein [Prosthecochloris ethylica]